MSENGLTTTTGTTGETARYTSTSGGGVGKSEVGYHLLLKTTEFSNITREAEDTPPRTIRHRILTTTITVPPPLSPSTVAPPSPLPPSYYHLPHGNRSAWGAYTRGLDSSLRLVVPTILHPEFPAASVLENLNETLRDTLMESLSPESPHNWHPTRKAPIQECAGHGRSSSHLQTR